MSIALQVKHLNKNIKQQHVLKDVNFEIESGSICAFIGPNGAGKTTTIKTIVGLYTATSGDVTVQGLSNSDPKSKFHIGYVPEKENFPKISAKTWLLEMGAYFNVESSLLNNEIQRYAEAFDVSNKLDESLPKLSSGQRKKIMIMQAFLHNPDIYIMDEPTENLDPDTRRLFYNIILELKKQGKTIMISTHNLDEIERYVDSIIVIGDGEIKYSGKWTGNGDLWTMYNEFKSTGVANFNKPIQPGDKYDALLREGKLTEDEVKILRKHKVS